MMVIKFIMIMLCWVGFPILLRSQVKIVARGGASFYKPRNTVVAVRLAWEYGSDGVVVDVFESKDAQWFAFRQDDVSAYANKAYRLSEMKGRKIESISLRNKLSKSSLVYHISHIEDVLSLLPTGKFFMIHLDKEVDNIGALFKVLKRHRNAKYIRYVSSDWKQLQYLSRRVDASNLFYEWDRSIALGGAIEKAKAMGITSFIVQAEQLNGQMVSWIKESGISIHVSLAENDNGEHWFKLFPSIVSFFTSRPRWVRTSLIETPAIPSVDVLSMGL